MFTDAQVLNGALAAGAAVLVGAGAARGESAGPMTLTPAAMSFTHAATAATTTSADAASKEEDPKPAPPPPPDEDGEIFKHWKGGIDLGLNGSEGNTESLNFRVAVGAKRTTKRQETTFSSVYSRKSQDSEVTGNRWDTALRNDWNLGESNWIVWAQGRVEYDDFQDWNWRVQLSAGLGYKFINSDTTKLLGRFGLGATKEFGGSRNEWIPEGVLGVDFTHQFDERQSIFFTVEYYPSLSDFPDYRLLARAGYQIVIDPKSGAVLKIGAENRYDSAVGGGKKKNDLDYFMTLGWTF